MLDDSCSPDTQQCIGPTRDVYNGPARGTTTSLSCLYIYLAYHLLHCKYLAIVIRSTGQNFSTWKIITCSPHIQHFAEITTVWILSFVGPIVATLPAMSTEQNLFVTSSKRMIISFPVYLSSYLCQQHTATNFLFLFHFHFHFHFRFHFSVSFSLSFFVFIIIFIFHFSFYFIHFITLHFTSFL